MSISLYYSARRSKPLSAAERKQIANTAVKYSVDAEIDRYKRTGDGHNWESFCIYDPQNPTAPDVIFEGATKLPDNSEEAIWDGLQHWCRALTDIRHVLADASWRVHVDDHEISWDDAAKEYDPSQ